jgi:hypothetical protein
MRIIPEIDAERENFRLVPVPGAAFATIKRDPIEPAPVGTLVALVFRVTGYDPDCDGSLMARLEHIDSRGRATGYTVNALGITSEVALDSADELHRLAATPTQEP